jgi:uncharacterized integral membrane protein
MVFLLSAQRASTIPSHATQRALAMSSSSTHDQPHAADDLRPQDAIADNGAAPAADAAAKEDAPSSLETPRGRSLRHARRSRLYSYAVVAVGLSAIVIALAASNTAKTKVSWIVGSSHVSLVWMVLAAVVLGWLLGLLTAAALHRRTRAPH